MKKLAGLIGLSVITAAVAVAVPAQAASIAPSTDEIEKYLIVGFKRSADGDAVNLQNGEFGADREVLSQGGTSPTGASFPTINSVFDQRWAPKGSEAYLVHPITGAQIAPFQGIDYSGNIALTSNTGRISVSDTDIFADLGVYDANLDDIGIVAASNKPVQSISNADYFSEGASENNPDGELPTNRRGTNGVGLEANVDLSLLTDDLEAWKTFIDDAIAEGSYNKNIEDKSYKEGNSKNKNPFLIELGAMGSSQSDSEYDLFFEDADGDGIVIIDIDRGGNDWEINNSDIIIDAAVEGLTAIFRVNGESNMNMSNSSIQFTGEESAVLFYKGNSEGRGSGDAVFAGNNVVYNNVAFWELNEGTSDRGKNEIDIQNGQGCAQFVGSTVLHTSNSRFNKCSFSVAHKEVEPVPEPLTILGTVAALGMGYGIKRRQSA